MKDPDVIVLGAGAAGLTAAIFAAEQGSKVLVLEKTPMAGRKILMSGGTRCNVLPVEMQPGDYFSASSQNLVNKIFKSWSLDACHRWFENEIGLEMVTEEASNKWFPASNSAREVRDLLVEKAERHGVQFRYNTAVQSLRLLEESMWEVHAKDGSRYRTARVVMATGGLSIPTTGTQGDGHRIMEAFGGSMESTYPALTPLTGPHPGSENLAGISLDVKLKVLKEAKVMAISNRSGFLFTHKGYSGPSVLDVSHWYIRDPGVYLEVDWLGEGAEFWEEQLAPSRMQVYTKVREFLPERLARALMQESGMAIQKNCAEMGKVDRKRLIQLLSAYPLHPRGSEGYAKAEVTGGGVRLEDINTATMEHKSLKGLYLCGEIIDVFGRIGGFNFYWAWVSGRLAGISISTNH